VLIIVKCSVMHTIADIEQAISTTSENYLGKPFRRILVLFRVIKAIATSGRLIPKTRTSTGIMDLFRPSLINNMTSH
jgi:hypothetical protein